MRSGQHFGKVTTISRRLKDVHFKFISTHLLLHTFFEMCTDVLEVNILESPGNGCYFPHSCALSVMLSANPEHGSKFYEALFPKSLRFTSVFTDSLTGCARFWFARWCCQKHDVREILDQSVKSGVCSHGQEGAGLSRNMRISDFLNFTS